MPQVYFIVQENFGMHYHSDSQQMMPDLQTQVSRVAMNTIECEGETPFLRENSDRY